MASGGDEDYSLESLEDEILEKMDWLNAPSRTHLAESQILRAGPFRQRPIWIHAPLRRQDPGIYLFRPAGLCNYLTMRRMVPEFRLRTIWLLPEFVHGAGHSITHLWIPEKEMLVFYLCPLRIYGSNQASELEKPAGSYSAGNIPLSRLESQRLDSSPGGRMRSARPFLESVFQTTKERQSADIGKFLLPDAALTEREIQDMERISDQWKREWYQRRH